MPISVCKCMTNQWDYGYVGEMCPVTHDCFKTVKVHIWDDDGDTFFFVQLMLCPEINTVYIVSCYGFAYSSLIDEGEFLDPTGYDNEWNCLCHDVIAPLLAWPTSPEILMFNQDVFDTATGKFKAQLFANADILSGSLDALVIRKIYEATIPEWVKIGEADVGPHAIDFKAQLGFHPYLSPDAYAQARAMFSHIIDFL